MIAFLGDRVPTAEELARQSIDMQPSYGPLLMYVVPLKGSIHPRFSAFTSHETTVKANTATDKAMDNTLFMVIAISTIAARSLVRRDTGSYLMLSTIRPTIGTYGDPDG